MSTIASEHFTQAVFILLDEVFENVHGVFLDKGNSLFETLAGITAEEASVPVGGKCASLAAQVKHAAFYLDVTEKSARDPNFPPADWGETWRTVEKVSPAEWDALRAELRESYTRLRRLIEETPVWSNEFDIVNALGVIAHGAYHLGEMRQALCILRA